MIKVFVLFLTFAVFQARASVEFKSSFIPSAVYNSKADFALTTQNSVIFQYGLFGFGPYFGFQSLSSNSKEMTLGATIRWGDSLFVELQGGSYTHQFSQHGTNLTGKGYSGNLIFGTHLGPHWGVSVGVLGKRISSGMDLRTIVEILPLLSLRVQW